MTINRNQGIEFDGDLVAALRCNHFAANKRVTTLLARRSVKGDAQTAWLANAIRCMDLTTLAGDDTAGRVSRLCAKAIAPVKSSLLKTLGLPADLHCGAVCVYPQFVSQAVKAVAGTKVAVASVATGFPTGLTPQRTRLAEVKSAVHAGANEIDMVITREHALTGNWRTLYREVASVREACGEAHLKVILATGDLQVLRTVMRAAFVAMAAGADFVKTSTGKETVNATELVSLAMLRTIRLYYELTGYQVGFKPAGGIGKAKQAIGYQILMKEELGRDWLEPDLFRIGASSLLGDIERQLEHRATGFYSAAHRHAVA